MGFTGIWDGSLQTYLTTMVMSYLNLGKYKIWKRSLEKAGIKGACFHDLIHDFVTTAMRGGNAPHIVIKQVGHKTDSMLRCYQLIDERNLLELQINPLVTT